MTRRAVRSVRAGIALLILAANAMPIGAVRPPAQQTPPQSGTTETPDDDRVVKLSVTLVQVDAIVSDKDGRTVTDLTKDDFEVLQDDRPQAITTFLYVSTPPLAAPASETAPPSDGPVPPARLGPASARRTIAVVVDDLTSNESARAARHALRSFVDQQMQPGDVIAIIQARAGAGALQQFSANRQELYAAIDRIRYVPRTRTALECEEVAQHDRDAEHASSLDEALRADIFVRGTLGVLNFVVRGLKEIPGRKSLVLLSDGMPCTFADVDPKGRGDRRVRRAMLGLVDQANRSSVAIYSIDVRGVDPLNTSASDNQVPVRMRDLGDFLLTRRTTEFRSRDLLSFLAQQTGGLFIYNTNDIAAGLRRAIDDQRGYYLIAYVPDDATFAPKAGERDFHSLAVRVKRPGVTVRSRTGFYGYPDEEAPPETRSPAQQMVDAVISPFAASGVSVQLTPLFADDPKSGPVVRCLLHIDARDLNFTEARDGMRQADLDLAVVAFGDSGGMVSRQARTQQIRVRADALPRIQAQGIDEIVTLPIKAPGAYQVRAAVRDAGSGRIGSAYHFVEMPDVNGGELAISGIVLSREAAAVAPRGLMMKGQAADAPQSLALRRFHRGDQISYGFEIYNASRDAARHKPVLELTVRVYHEGKLIHSGETKPLDTGAQTDPARIRIGRGLQLGTEMQTGSYVLELEVAETSSKRRVATQWIDFDVE